MADPVIANYLGVRGYVVLWLVTALSFSAFGLRVIRYLQILWRARAENRWDNWGRRLRLFVGQVLGQRRLLREPVIGVAHLVIFWAFVFYAVGFFWSLARGLLPFLPFPYPDELWWMAFALTAFGALGLAALAVSAVRRYVFTPAGLERSRDATLILVLIALVLVSSLAGLRLKQRAPEIALAMWWLHMVTVLGFLAYLPYSKHLHLLAAPFGVLFGSLHPGGIPPPSEGASRREEFTWRELFNGLACAECGRCERACPQFQSGARLSPKTLMHSIKELVRSPNCHALLGEAVTPEQVWACATCYACMDRCPVFNEHIPVTIEMRRRLVANGELDAGLQTALTNLTRYGNSFGVSPRIRSKWAQGLNGKIADARKQAVEYLWFAGDYASFDRRLLPASTAMARVLQRVGLDFGMLYESEQNSGNDVRRVGEEGLFEILREKNRKALEKGQFSQIVTSDPHTYHCLKNEYGLNGGVMHSSELFDRLKLSGELKIRVTYQDPCYLGRYNGVYEAPRRTLRRLGAELIEMPRNRADSQCCGAGGGRIWMEDIPGVKERPAEKRVREAASLPGVEALVVSCPKDLVMFQDAVKTVGLEGKLAVKELAELVEQATRKV